MFTLTGQTAGPNGLIFFATGIAGLFSQFYIFVIHRINLGIIRFLNLIQFLVLIKILQSDLYLL